MFSIETGDSLLRAKISQILFKSKNIFGYFEKYFFQYILKRFDDLLEFCIFNKSARMIYNRYHLHDNLVKNVSSNCFFFEHMRTFNGKKYIDYH
jgi:hypothetical protein